MWGKALLLKPTLTRVKYNKDPRHFIGRIEVLVTLGKYQLSVENVPVVSLNPLMNRK